MHHFVPDGIDPSKLFLTIYYKNKKYWLTGDLPIELHAINEVSYIKNPSPAFSDLPNVVQDYCYKKWDKFVDNFKTEMVVQ